MLEHKDTAPTEFQTNCVNTVKEAAADLVDIVNDHVLADSKEKEYAIMKINEAMFWSNAAILHGPESEEAANATVKHSEVDHARYIRHVHTTPAGPTGPPY